MSPPPKRTLGSAVPAYLIPSARQAPAMQWMWAWAWASMLPPQALEEEAFFKPFLPADAAARRVRRWVRGPWRGCEKCEQLAGCKRPEGEATGITTS